MDRRTALMRVGALAAAIVPGMAAGPAGAAAPANQGSRWGSYFPNVALRTQDDRTVRFYDDLVKVQQLLGGRVGRDIFMYSITLDPANDRGPLRHH